MAEDQTQPQQPEMTEDEARAQAVRRMRMDVLVASVLPVCAEQAMRLKGVPTEDDRVARMAATWACQFAQDAVAQVDDLFRYRPPAEPKPEAETEAA